MRFADWFGPFLDTLRNQRARTTLTVLGITWGTVAVVVLLAFGVGLEKNMRKQARGIGEAIAILGPGNTTKPFAGFPEGRRIQVVESDAALIKREVAGISVATPEYGRWGTPVRRGEQAANPYVTGVLPEYEDLRNVFPEPGGRFLNALDVEGRRRVAFLGDELKTLLFGEEEAVGKEVMIGGTPFTVVGVMRKKQQNSSYQQRDKDRIFIPASTFQSVFGARYVARILYQAKDPAQSEAVTRQVREVLARKYTFDPEDEDAVGIWDTSQGEKFFRALFLGFNVFLGIVGSFTLIVGGIGVANIMYVVVRERTREIGIRRALGARRSTVLGQILLETFVIVGVGAVLGIVLSVLLVKGAASLPIEEQVGVPTISPIVMTATLVLLAVVAFLAGLFPARRAAGLDPVEALRS